MAFELTITGHRACQERVTTEIKAHRIKPGRWISTEIPVLGLHVSGTVEAVQLEKAEYHHPERDVLHVTLKGGTHLMFHPEDDVTVKFKR